MSRGNRQNRRRHQYRRPPTPPSNEDDDLFEVEQVSDIRRNDLGTVSFPSTIDQMSILLFLNSITNDC